MRITFGELRKLIMENFPTWDELPKRDQLLSIYSDVYKEKYGVRPRGMMAAMQDMSDEEIEAELDRLQNEPGGGDWDEPEPEPEFSMAGEVTPEEQEDVHPMEDLPTEIPFKGGNEYDALGAGKDIHIWRPGQRKAAKKTYNRRLRHTK